MKDENIEMLLGDTHEETDKKSDKLKSSSKIKE